MPDHHKKAISGISAKADRKNTTCPQGHGGPQRLDADPHDGKSKGCSNAQKNAERLVTG